MLNCQPDAPTKSKNKVVRVHIQKMRAKNASWSLNSTPPLQWVLLYNVIIHSLKRLQVILFQCWMTFLIVGVLQKMRARSYQEEETINLVKCEGNGLWESLIVETSVKDPQRVSKENMRRCWCCSSNCDPYNLNLDNCKLRWNKSWLRRWGVMVLTFLLVRKLRSMCC